MDGDTSLWNSHLSAADNAARWAFALAVAAVAVILWLWFGKGAWDVPEDIAEFPPKPLTKGDQSVK